MRQSIRLCVLSLLVVGFPRLASAQTCTVHLSELNYDCALAAGVASDSCEFIELGFAGTFTPGVTAVDACGIAAVKLINGASIACGVEDTIALPSTPIPADGLFVIGRAGVPNVDLTPTSGSWSSTTSGAIQNGNPDWIRLVGDTAAQDKWYAYEFNAVADASKNCFAKAGSIGEVAFIGEDYDANTNSPPPEVREESISLCGSGANAAYLGDDEAGGLTGPLATPGETNACDSRLPWDSGDAGIPDAATTADTGTPADAASSPDTATLPDSASAPDTSGGSDAAACGGLTFIGECQGTTVRWCDDGEVQTYDCADDSARCGLVDCTDTDCYGYDCVAGAGEACGTSDVELACDVGAGYGCRAGVCAASPTCDVDTYVDNCSGTFVLYCGTTRVWDEDCSLGGTEPYICGAAVGGGVDCLGLVDAYCDPVYDLNCAPGLTCTQNTCEGTLLIDAGTSAGDAATGADQASVPDGAGGPDASSSDAGATDAAGAADASVAQDSGGTLDAGVQPDSAARPDTASASDIVMGLDVRHTVPDAGFTEVEPGCSCATTRTAEAPLVLGLLGVLAALRRRQRR